MKIDVGLWCRSNADRLGAIGGGDIQQRYNELQNAVVAFGKAAPEQGSGEICRIFVAPEYYFADPNAGVPDHMAVFCARSLIEGDRDKVVTWVRGLSERHHKMLLVPGSIAWLKPLIRSGGREFKRDRKTGLPDNTRPKSSDPWTKAQQHLDAAKMKPRREALPEQSEPANSFHAQRIQVWLDANQAVYVDPLSKASRKATIADVYSDTTLRNWAIANGLRLPENDELMDIVPTLAEKEAKLADSCTTAIVRNSLYGFVDGSFVMKYNKKADFHEAVGVDRQDSVFIPGNRSGVCKLGGLTFGFEICLDHFGGVLRQDDSASADRLDVHVIASDSVTNTPTNMCIKEGGYCIHASTEIIHTHVFRKTAGAMIPLPPDPSRPDIKSAGFNGFIRHRLIEVGA